ncbi:MAG: carbohydrate ABC transporter permease [Clostridiales bacterium]|nr:carbohydrate ABC transporter permease [Clostridiales bacterium]
MSRFVTVNGIKIMKPKKDNSILIQRTTVAEKFFFVAMALFCALYAFSLVFPVVWLLIKSLEDTFSYDLNLVMYGWDYVSPLKDWKPGQYIDAFNELQLEGITFAGMLVNSAWWVGIGTFQTIFWHATTAYIISKYRFVGRNFLYSYVITMAILPVYGSGGSAYKLINDLGLYDQGPFYLIMTTFGGLGGSFLTMVGLFSSISWEYAEAVYIDGGSDNTVYFNIMLPQAMPMLSAFSITSAVGLWNNYGSPLMYLPSTPTVATGLYKIKSGISYVGMPYYFCGLVITLIPVMVLYGFIAEKMMTNLSIGGLKG